MASAMISQLTRAPVDGRIWDAVGVVLGQDMFPHCFSANCAPSSVPVPSALTFDPFQLFLASYGAFSCSDLVAITVLPVCESCAG